MEYVLEWILRVLIYLICAESLILAYFALQNYQSYKLEKMHLEQDLAPEHPEDE